MSEKKEKYRRTNFLVTLIFDENSGIKKQVDTELSFKNTIVKELQKLVTGKAIKHFIVANDEIINDKLKECNQESDIDKIRAEIDELEEGISSYHNDRPWLFKDEVLQIIDKYRDKNKE